MKPSQLDIDTRGSVRVPASTCPNCGRKQTGASGLDTRYPEEGDVAICIDCASVNVYGRALTLIPWPASEPVPPEVFAAREAVLRLHRKVFV